MKVLVVDDDPRILELLSAYFHAKGHQVTVAEDGVEALKTYQQSSPDLILLDIKLPHLDGWAVLDAIRSQSQTPVIFLTALDNKEDIIRGLSMGGDDYLCKPFEIRELDARVQAVLRRANKLDQSPLLQASQILINDRTKEVTVGERPVSLSPKEFELLKLLASDPGRVFAAEEILVRLWPTSTRAMTSDVKQYVHLLRNKIESDRNNPHYIQTVKGFGYRLSA